MHLTCFSNVCDWGVCDETKFIDMITDCLPMSKTDLRPIASIWDITNLDVFLKITVVLPTNHSKLTVSWEPWHRSLLPGYLAGCSWQGSEPRALCFSLTFASLASLFVSFRISLLCPAARNQNGPCHQAWYSYLKKNTFFLFLRRKKITQLSSWRRGRDFKAPDKPVQ